MKTAIPHLLTLLNLFSGCVATVFAALNRLDLAALWVCIGIFFDFLDGFAARMLKVESALGVQLDSLADMVTSGLVPGIVMFQLLATTQPTGWTPELWPPKTYWALIPFLGFTITLGSAYRLAYFNIDNDQTHAFKGLPTPANTILILSLPPILLYHNNEILNSLILNEGFLIGLTFVSTFLLNCRIRLFALKFKNWSFRDNAVRYLFLTASLVLLLTLQFLAIPIVVLLYILASLAAPPSKKG